MMNKSLLIQFLKHKIEVLVFILFWIFYLFFVYNGLGKSWEKVNHITWSMTFISFPLVFNLNAFFLIPRYLKKKKWLKYSIILLSLTLFLESLKAVLLASKTADTIDSFIHAFNKFFIFYQDLFLPIFLGILFSYVYRFSRDWLINLKLIEKLEAEKTSMELAFLKSQVDPHFLFNTLNSLYALALEENAEKTADSVTKLGTLMRYNLHDSQASDIELEKEIVYIKNYLELQKLRLSEKNKITLNIDIKKNGERYAKIAPMLLIVFIENAFKYAINPGNNSYIIIDVSLYDLLLTFKVKNSVTSKKPADKNNGIGLHNVKNRLDLLYPGKHILTIKDSGDEFLITLQMDLNK